MKDRLTGCAVLFLFVLLVPCVITLLVGHDISIPASGTADGAAGQVQLGENGQRVDLQEYLIGVTAAQLPGDYSLEAVKAQMILNRTYYYSVLGERTSLSAEELTLTYLSAAERAAHWKAEECEQAESVFLQAAVETEGQVMTCQKELAVGMYHQASAGRTRSLTEDYPYLHSVESTQDVQMKDYLTLVEYSIQALSGRLETLCGETLSESALRSGLQILKKDEGGYVDSLMVGTGTYTGDQVAECLGLPSSAFSLQWLDNGNLQMICRGAGHGYGMSQYGANCMALEGKTAAEILKYYFQNVAVETWKRGE